MKKFIASFHVEVFADTEEEARKIAMASFVARPENDLLLVEMEPRTERCDICQHTYVPSEVVEKNGEQLCAYCCLDKYGRWELSPEDIPF